MTSKSLNVDRKKQYKGRRRGLRGKGIINILSFLKNDKLFIALKGGFFFKFIFICLFFLAALGLRCCAQAFSSCGERGLLFIVVHGLLIVVASLVERGL